MKYPKVQKQRMFTYKKLKNFKPDKILRIAEFPKVKLYKRKPTKKVENKGKFKRKADKLLSIFIRSLDHCERCSATRNQAQLQTAHIYSRGNLRLRYDIQNVLCLCAKCHMWAHHEPLEFAIFLQQAYPERITYLRKHKDEYKKMTVKDYQKIIKDLQNFT